jgi:phosphatidylinositol glycan class A protein
MLGLWGTIRFLKCSLIDAFCVSIVEAAACGLYVMTMDVGGIPEVLPEAARTLCPPSATLVTQALLSAIRQKRTPHGRAAQQIYGLITWRLSWGCVARQLLAIDARKLATNFG